MGGIDIILPDELAQEFRTEVAKQLGMKKGNLTLAVQEAGKSWIETRRKHGRNVRKIRSSNSRWRRR